MSTLARGNFKCQWCNHLASLHGYGKYPCRSLSCGCPKLLGEKPK